MIRHRFSTMKASMGPAHTSLVIFAAAAIALAAQIALADPARWHAEWPKTDFSKATVDLASIRSGGPPKDGIPSIDSPKFETLIGGTARGWAADIGDTEAVISVSIKGDARAYPLRVLVWHEIVNDTVGGMPLALTYCPLCNAALAFERVIDGRVLDFGTTGKLRHSDLVMYDRQTESWWQQFTGEAIAGALAGTSLKLVPSRLESFDRFRKRFPDGRVLVPNDPNLRRYGTNPYVRYDEIGKLPFLYQGDLPDGIHAMERVVAVEVAPDKHEAWALSLLREQGEIRTGNVVIRWEAGQASALDAATVGGGRDVGNVVVQRQTGGLFEDVPYDVTFAFVFHVFRPHGTLHRGRL
jgi:hypothetical protein